MLTITLKRVVNKHSALHGLLETNLSHIIKRAVDFMVRAVFVHATLPGFFLAVYPYTA